MTLGELIHVLGTIPPEAPVVFDFCGLLPTQPDSYRGYYDELAFGFIARDYATKEPTACDVLAWSKAALSRTFTGYKGGTYTMGDYTRLWVDNYGESTGTALVGAFYDGHRVMLATAVQS